MLVRPDACIAGLAGWKDRVNGFEGAALPPVRSDLEDGPLASRQSASAMPKGFRAS